MSLKFRPDVVAKVREGSVTMQFGLWRRPRVVAGRVYDIPDVGTVRVTAVEKVDLKRITPWEAEASGAKGVAQLLEWLKEDKPEADIEEGYAYRIRFRFIGPAGGKEAAEGGPAAEGEDKEGTDETEAGAPAEDKGAAREGKDRPTAAPSRTGEKGDAGKTAPAPAVQPKAISVDLLQWFDRDPWHAEYLRALQSGVWRNADELATSLGSDAATVRRRLGDMRKRGLVNSHRHHGYRITPEGQGALARMSEGGERAATATSELVAGRTNGSDVLAALRDGEWRNANMVAEAVGLSVVSVQRRVAALRDRGLVESHRRRGYRLTEKGRAMAGPATDATGPSSEAGAAAEPLDAPAVATAREAAVPEPAVSAPQPVADGAAAPVTTEAPRPSAAPAVAPVPASLVEWIGNKPYRRDLLLAMRPGRFVSSGELSTRLSTSVTTLHGRLKTLKERDLVDAQPRFGYTLTPLGERASAVMRVMTSKGRGEPLGAEAFLSAEPPSWGESSQDEVAVAPPTRAIRPPGVTRLATSGECGFCRATSGQGAREGWVRLLQTHLEGQPDPSTKAAAIPCSRGVVEDAHWFLIVERDPLAEGHCKLISKEHVADLVELGELALRDPRLASARDALARDLPLATEVVSSLDPRIVDVMLLSGLEHGVHLCFDLVPRYRMDLPGIRSLASVRSHYDDLSLARKRRLWEERRDHMQEVATRLREAAARILRSHPVQGVTLSDA